MPPCGIFECVARITPAGRANAPPMIGGADECGFRGQVKSVAGCQNVGGVGPHVGISDGADIRVADLPAHEPMALNHGFDAAADRGAKLRSGVDDGIGRAA